MACITTSMPSSSSTIRMSALAMMRSASRRQADGEGGALARPAARADGAAVVAHDAVGDPQPQAGSFLSLGLSGEEGIEDVGHVLLGNAAAGVTHRDVDGLAAEQVGIGVGRVARADVDG